MHSGDECISFLFKSGISNKFFRAGQFATIFPDFKMSNCWFREEIIQKFFTIFFIKKIFRRKRLNARIIKSSPKFCSQNMLNNAICSPNVKCISNNESFIFMKIFSSIISSELRIFVPVFTDLSSLSSKWSEKS